MDATAGASVAPSPQGRALMLVEILTVGLPFSAFKLACGVPLIGAGAFALLGWSLVVWGFLDAFLNVVNAGTAAALGRRHLPVCLLQALTHAARRTPRGANLGTALDMMLSFILVAVMIGTGALSQLSPSWLSTWNLAVVLNVLGAGALRLAEVLLPPTPAGP